MNIFKKLYLKLKEDTQIIDKLLFNENINPKYEKIRKEILILMKITPFPTITLAVIGSYFSILKKGSEEGSGFVLFIYVIVYLLWVFAIVHINSSQKSHYNHGLKEKN